MKKNLMYIIFFITNINLYAQPVYLADSFPSISKRISLFEEKMNSKNLEIKLQAFSDILYFYDVIDTEIDKFLKYIIENEQSNELIGRAIHNRYSLFLDFSNIKIPTQFRGYHTRQIINLKNENTIPDLIKGCYIPELPCEKEKKKLIKKKGDDAHNDTFKVTGTKNQKGLFVKPANMQAEPGYNAYVLGVINCKDADKALIHLYKNTNNIFVEYTAARALVSIGKRDIGIKFLKEIVSDYFAIKPESSTQYDVHYVISSCWAISFEDREYSINNLMEVYKNLEKFHDANTLSRKKYLRVVMTNITGELF